MFRLYDRKYASVLVRTSHVGSCLAVQTVIVVVELVVMVTISSGWIFLVGYGWQGNSGNFGQHLSLARGLCGTRVTPIGVKDRLLAPLI